LVSYHNTTRRHYPEGTNLKFQNTLYPYTMSENWMIKISFYLLFYMGVKLVSSLLENTMENVWEEGDGEYIWK